MASSLVTMKVSPQEFEMLMLTIEHTIIIQEERTNNASLTPKERRDAKEIQAQLLDLKANLRK